MIKLLRSVDSDSHSLAALVKPVDIPEDQAASIRARQLETAGRLTPVMVLANLVNASVVLVSFWHSPAIRLLGLWGALLFVASAILLIANMRARRKAKRRKRERIAHSADKTQQGIERFSRLASFVGLVWGILPLLIMPFEDETSQLAVSIIMAGMMFGGVVLISRIPEAAQAFLIPTTIGFVVGLQLGNDPRNEFLSILALVYASVLWISIRWSYRQFVEQHLSGAAVQHQAQLIGLLLRDFEESTSDWLWQTDASGLLEEIPLPVSGEKSVVSAMAQGAAISTLFADNDAKRLLVSNLEKRQPFRDITLQVAGEEAVWWSLTGKPVFDSVGNFSGFRGVASDVSQSKEIEDRIAFMAHFDPLTSLPNRACLNARLDEISQTPAGEGVVRALLWLDLDNFKWVNDTLGHPAGDELLCQVASRLKQGVKDALIIARLGGDEFAILVESRGQDELIAQIRALSESLNTPYEIWGSSAHCGASIGVKIVDNYTTDISTLFKHADLALYQAKEAGKRTWCIFSDKLAERARIRRETEVDLHRALENNELLTYFQPQMSASTGEIVGCETLLRWKHPTRGLIGPGNFIKHAEDTGFITRLGDWTLREALRVAKRFPDDMRVAVNISPLQIHSANLLSTIVNALATNCIEPSRLELEITESVLLSDTEFTLERLRKLKELGVRISLDDFGTGFSSLSYLRRFPFDKLKIDKGFVQDIDHSEECRAIARATLQLAKALNMVCTAEGVETEGQKQFLTENGCDELQGFLISRPQPLEKLTHLFNIRDEVSEPEAGVSTAGEEGLAFPANRQTDKFAAG